MQVRRWVAGIAWVPLVVPAACSDGGEPSAEPSGPTSSSAATPSGEPSPSPSGPSVPPEAVGSDEASARAFVRYWFEVLSEAMVTGDTDPIEPLSVKRCQSCRSIAGRIDNIYDKGGRLRTQGWRIDRMTPRPIAEAKTAFYLRIKQLPSTLLDEDKKVVSEGGAEVSAAQIILRRRKGAWVVEALDFIR